MESAPGGVCRLVPEITICATLMAPGSLTARVPVSVAKGVSGLSPVQPWQLTQAPWKTVLPRALAVPPLLGDSGAGGASVTGSLEAAAGPPGGEAPRARI